MATLAGLADRLRKEAKEIEQSASDAAVQVALTVLGELTVRTPVDTSKASSNWQVRTNSPVDNEIDAYFIGKSGSTAQSSVDAAYLAGVEQLSSKKPGETIYISNVTKYIEYLNDGSSYQAPAGFVERAVMVGNEKAKSVRILKNGR